MRGKLAPAKWPVRAGTLLKAVRPHRPLQAGIMTAVLQRRTQVPQRMGVSRVGELAQSPLSVVRT